MLQSLDSRTRALNRLPQRTGRYVLYLMQASQRARDNPALEVAIDHANGLGLPVLCVFGLFAAYPEANLRHFAFMLPGLAACKEDLEHQGIRMIVLQRSPDEAALALSPDAAIVVCDAGYLNHQRKWRARVARECGTTVLEVESDVVVPVYQVSDKQEWSAAKIGRASCRERVFVHV
jgi:deoxyribodipyrimidine photo-lyase